MHKIIQQKDWKVTNWSGGTTSEVYIYPENSNFKRGDYQLRISIATVEVNDSNFTPLPNVDRVLTVLDGEIQLIHENHHSIVLKQYEQDVFSGNWFTKSIGKVRDFNVMAKDHKVKVNVIHLEENQSIELKKNDFVFVAEGKLSVSGEELNNNTALLLNADDILKTSMKTVLICSVNL